MGISYSFDSESKEGLVRVSVWSISIYEIIYNYNINDEIFYNTDSYTTYDGLPLPYKTYSFLPSGAIQYYLFNLINLLLYFIFTLFISFLVNFIKRLFIKKNQNVQLIQTKNADAFRAQPDGLCASWQLEERAIRIPVRQAKWRDILLAGRRY